MERKCILFYSKYFNGSAQLAQLMGSFGFVEFFCVDNSNNRKSLKNNKELNIRVVPTFIVIKSGTAEKYEGIEQINGWMLQENTKKRVTFDMEPQYDNPDNPEITPLEDIRQFGDEQEIQEITEIDPEIEETPFENRESERRKYQQLYLKKEEEDEKRRKKKKEKVALREFQSRNKTPKPPARIRKDRSNYENDEKLFQGDVPDNRGSKKVEDPHGTLEKAKKMAQMRDNDERVFGNPANQPFDARRNN